MLQHLLLIFAPRVCPTAIGIARTFGLLEWQAENSNFFFSLHSYIKGSFRRCPPPFDFWILILCS